MKAFNSPVNLDYLSDLITIYDNIPQARGHIENPRTSLYANLPCLARSLSNTWLNQVLGTSVQGRWRIVLPRATAVYASVTIKNGYRGDLTWNGRVYHVEIVAVTEYPESHIEAEADERKL